MDVEKKVLLLAIYKRKEDESLTDVLLTLEASKVFTLKQGKQYLKALKNENYLHNNELTVVGVSFAKEVEKEFSL